MDGTEEHAVAIQFPMTEFHTWYRRVRRKELMGLEFIAQQQRVTSLFRELKKQSSSGRAVEKYKRASLASTDCAFENSMKATKNRKRRSNAISISQKKDTHLPRMCRTNAQVVSISLGDVPSKGYGKKRRGPLFNVCRIDFECAKSHVQVGPIALNKHNYIMTTQDSGSGRLN